MDIPAGFGAQLKANLSQLQKNYTKLNQSLVDFMRYNVSAPSVVSAQAYYATAQKFEGDILQLTQQALQLRAVQTSLKERLRSLSYRYEQGNASLVNHLTQELTNRDAFWKAHAQQYEYALKTSPLSVRLFRIQLEGAWNNLQRDMRTLQNFTADSESFESQYAAQLRYLNGLQDELDSMEKSLTNLWFEHEFLASAEKDILAFLKVVAQQVAAGKTSIPCGQDAIASVAGSNAGR
jgi:chromosome segregation ATPase